MKNDNFFEEEKGIRDIEKAILQKHIDELKDYLFFLMDQETERKYYIVNHRLDEYLTGYEDIDDLIRLIAERQELLDD